MRILAFLFLFTSLALRAQNPITHAVYFPTNSTTLSQVQVDSLGKFFEKLGDLKMIDLRFFGYCDSRGTDAKNKILATRRAEKIKNMFVQMGIPEKLITKVEGFGELADGLKENTQEEKWAGNRRVDIVVFYLKEEKTPIKQEVPPIQEPTAEKKSVLADNLKAGDKVTLSNILFIGGRHFLLKESYPTLDSLVQTLRDKPQYSITILGHVCCMAPGNDGEDFDTHQFNLSVTRAKAIYDYLIQNGIDPSRLGYKGMKSDYPTGRGDKYDRRVEIEISKVTGQ
jgi:outer membrane protein OmpA-like peptidoglycan-associated protein